MKTKLFIFILINITLIASIDNGLGLTPQMGWNSWNHYHCDGLNQEVVKQTAQSIVDQGFDKLGYEYINLDDCWQISRDPETHVIQADPNSFPDGIPALVDFVHNLGLKFGLYSDAGTHTCAGRPGSLGYELIDAKTYSEWGVDYLKYDNCNNEHIQSKYRYNVMYQALKVQNKPIFFSMCNWGHQAPWKWGPSIANSWRTTFDIEDNWLVTEAILELNVGLWKFAGPGGWNDPDMLEIGNGGMTIKQQQMQFCFWSLLKAPLLIGCDVPNMPDSAKEILSNQDIIGVNQDKLGKQGVRLKVDLSERYELWAIPQSDNSTVIITWNKSGQEKTFTFTFDDICNKLQTKFQYPCSLGNTVAVRDLIVQKDVGVTDKQIGTSIEKHYVSMLKLTPQ